MTIRDEPSDAARAMMLVWAAHNQAASEVPMAETIDITPVGVQKDPARVNRALDAFQKAQADAANTLIAFVVALRDADGGWVAPSVERLLKEYEIDDVIRTCEDAQEEFLRAVAGAPSRGGRE